MLLQTITIEEFYFLFLKISGNQSNQSDQCSILCDVAAIKNIAVQSGLPGFCIALPTPDRGCDRDE